MKMPAKINAEHLRVNSTLYALVVELVKAADNTGHVDITIAELGKRAGIAAQTTMHAIVALRVCGYMAPKWPLRLNLEALAAGRPGQLVVDTHAARPAAPPRSKAVTP